MVSSYARTKEASQAKYISILNIIQGEVDPTQVMFTALQIFCLSEYFPTTIKVKQELSREKLAICFYWMDYTSIHFHYKFCP